MERNPPAKAAFGITFSVALGLPALVMLAINRDGGTAGWALPTIATAAIIFALAIRSIRKNSR